MKHLRFLAIILAVALCSACAGNGNSNEVFYSPSQSLAPSPVSSSGPEPSSEPEPTCIPQALPEGTVVRYLRDDGAFYFDILADSKDSCRFRFWDVMYEENIFYAAIYDGTVSEKAGCTEITGGGEFSDFRVHLTGKTADVEASGQEEALAGRYTLSDYPVFRPAEYKYPVSYDVYTTDFRIDAGLAEGIRIQEGLAPETPLTGDLLSGIMILYINEPGLASLDGLEYCTNLTDFSAIRTYVSDISVITGLTQLKYFSLGGSLVSEIPDLSPLTSLENLDLSMSLISDPSNASRAPNLHTLGLTDSLLTSAVPLLEFRNLQALYISGNCLTDIDILLDRPDLCTALENADYDISLAVMAADRAKEIVRSITTDSMTDLEKEYKIYCYVRDNIRYEVVYGFMKPFAYTSLVEGRGVCGNFAEAFTMLSMTAGIGSRVIISDTHEWSLARIDGSWYHVDALWDQGSEPDWPSFFNRGSAFISETEDHTYNKYYYPDTCDMDKLFYSHMLSD